MLTVKPETAVTAALSESGRGPARGCCKLSEDSAHARLEAVLEI